MKLNCKLKNCYGIKAMDYCFDFDSDNVICLYARNGLMKTSFTKTLKKIQDGKEEEVCDEIYEKKGIVDVTIDGLKINKNDVFVIKSLENFYESGSISDLLIDGNLKKELENVLAKKDKFLQRLESYSGLKITRTSGGRKVQELVPKVINDLGLKEESFLLNLENILLMTPEYEWHNIKYNDIFDKVVLKKIKDDTFQAEIENFYIEAEKIYEKHEFLAKGEFTLPKLKKLSKALKEESFFVKDNAVYLQGVGRIDSALNIEEKIKEIEEELKTVDSYKRLASLLGDVRGSVLNDVIENNPEIIEYLKLEKLNILKKDLWLSYIESENDRFNELIKEYRNLEEKISVIDIDDTPWKNALNIFEERFTVPYKMKISNLKGAIIGESIPRVIFEFRDGEDYKSINRAELEELNVLSQGEKRALYLLNIIFDIERLKMSDEEKLIVVDDIADSFDYKNKYAIIEYLYDIAKDKNFKLLILSHNFDFYRTVSSRLGISRKNHLMAVRENDAVKIIEEKYQKQPFNFWKGKLVVKNIIGLIPFVRNIIEYGKDREVSKYEEDDYLIMTNLLHEKNKTYEIDFGTLRVIYEEYLGVNKFKEVKDDEKVITRLIAEADKISSENVNLEHKNILAMAIRHKAEKYMLEKIGDYDEIFSWDRGRKTGTRAEFMLYLDHCYNQTKELINVYKQFGDKKSIQILDEVNIITPENIHVNSFMFEPMLDTDINELLNLYEKVKKLDKNANKC